MTVYENDLPGVGKKHEVDLGDGSRLVIVTHNTGRREVFRRASPDADSEKLFELGDDLARTVGTVLEGAYYQPVTLEDVETALGANSLLDWYEVPSASPLAGVTLAESDVRGKTGASVIAIERGEETIPNPGADEELAAGDTLVVIGTRESVAAFAELLAGE